MGSTWSFCSVLQRSSFAFFLGSLRSPHTCPIQGASENLVSLYADLGLLSPWPPPFWDFYPHFLVALATLNSVSWLPDYSCPAFCLSSNCAWGCPQGKNIGMWISQVQLPAFKDQLPSRHVCFWWVSSAFKLPLFILRTEFITITCGKVSQL